MHDLETIARIADPGAKKHGNRWRIRCPNPAHEDKTPSCDITMRGDMLVWHCHGCKDQEGVYRGLEASGAYQYKPTEEQRSARLAQMIEAERWKKELHDEIKAANPDKVEPGEAEDPMQPIPVRKFQAVDWPPPKPLMGPLNAGSVNLIGGTSAVGKSWFALAVANAVAAGQRLGRWTATGQYDALLVDGELTGAQLTERQSDIEYSGDFDVISSSWAQRHGFGRLDLMVLEAQAHLIAICAQYEVVILDNLFGLFPSTDKAPATSMEYWLAVDALCTHLKQQGCCVLLFDHMAEYQGKTFETPDGEKFFTNKVQGTVSKRWSVDTVGVMMRSSRAKPEEAPRFMLSYNYENGGKVREKYDPVNHGDSVMQFKDGWFRRCG